MTSLTPMTTKNTPMSPSVIASLRGSQNALNARVPNTSFTRPETSSRRGRMQGVSQAEERPLGFLGAWAQAWEANRTLAMPSIQELRTFNAERNRIRETLVALRHAS